MLTSFNLFAQKLNVVGGYFPSWRSTSSANFNHYNYLYYAFAFPSVNGEILDLNPVFFEFLDANKSNPAKKFISVGSTGLPEMAKDSIASLKFADTLRSFCKVHQLQGIDMDWEAIDNEVDMKNFTRLMKMIRNEIDTTNLEFSITLGFGNYWMQWYEDEALQTADFLQIMIYDQTGTWSGSPFGNHASMDHFLQAESYWVSRGYPRNKLVMGLPYYGYKFKSNKGGLASAVTYADILTQFPNMKSSDNLLSDNTGYYWFNGADLIKEKTEYAINNGFKGVFVWEIAQDDLKSPLSLDSTLAKTAGTLTLGIEKLNSSETTISIYPNPCNNSFKINGLSNDFINGEIKIQNQEGKTISKFKINEIENGEYILKNIIAGFYTVSFTNNSKSKVYYSKLVIN